MRTVIVINARVRNNRIHAADRAKIAQRRARLSAKCLQKAQLLLTVCARAREDHSPGQILPFRYFDMSLVHRYLAALCGLVVLQLSLPGSGVSERCGRAF